MYLYRKDLSHKGAKRCRVSKGFSLRLCAFAREIFLFPNAMRTFRAKPIQPYMREAHMNKHLLCLVVLLLLGFTNTTLAQEVTARIDGQVTDPAGAVVTSAAITLTNTKTGEIRTVQSGDSGSYTVTQLQP